MTSAVISIPFPLINQLMLKSSLCLYPYMKGWFVGMTQIEITKQNTASDQQQFNEIQKACQTAYNNIKGVEERVLVVGWIYLLRSDAGKNKWRLVLVFQYTEEKIRDIVYRFLGTFCIPDISICDNYMTIGRFFQKKEEFLK